MIHCDGLSALTFGRNVYTWQSQEQFFTTLFHIPPAVCSHNRCPHHTPIRCNVSATSIPALIGTYSITYKCKHILTQSTWLCKIPCIHTHTHTHTHTHPHACPHTGTCTQMHINISTWLCKITHPHPPTTHTHTYREREREEEIYMLTHTHKHTHTHTHTHTHIHTHAHARAHAHTCIHTHTHTHTCKPPSHHSAHEHYTTANHSSNRNITGKLIMHLRLLNTMKSKLIT